MGNKGNRDNLVLVGFMGCGKSTVGIRLSWKYRMPAIDTDKLIERRMGNTIAQIFEIQGEQAFRQMETELLKELSEQPYRRVISVGGGTPVRQENLKLLKKCGTVVYLRMTAEGAYKRLRGDKNRPLLQCENPQEAIKRLLEERQKAYEECADIIVDVDNLTMDEVLAQVEESWRVYSAKKQSLKKILVINGPNLNFLGIREKSVYGNQDYQYLCDMIAKKGRETQSETIVWQSNHEGAIIDKLQEAYFDNLAGIVINPGAYTHYSYAIRDALASITVPKVEVHISDIQNREDFRKVSVTAPVCDKQVYGKGLEGYLEAIDYILNRE